MKSENQILQFRIMLKDIDPPIWRRIQVPARYSLWDLHVAVQDAMGWLDYHLHAFRFPGEEWLGKEIGIPLDNQVDEPGFETMAGWEFAADELFRAPGDSAEYEYDFGDDWRHEILLEEILEAEEGVQYPRCIDGARACPPEDCGGPYGYAEMLETLKHPEEDEEEAGDLIEWLQSDITRYPPFSSERFELDRIRFDDPTRRWKFAFLKDEDSPAALPLRDASGRPAAVIPQSVGELEIEDIIEDLRFFTGEYERAAVDAAIEHSEAVIPHLIEILAEALKDPEEIANDPDMFGHLYALMLCGYLRVEAAHEIIAALAALPDDLPHRLFDDTITMDYPTILVRTCGGNFDAIRTLAANKDADEWGRSAGIDALAFAVPRGMLQREDVLAFFAGLLDQPEIAESEFIPSHIVYRMIELYPEGFTGRIEQAFDAGLIDETYVSRDEIEEALAIGIDACYDKLIVGADLYPLENMHASMEWWACFHEEDDFKFPDQFPGDGDFSIPGLAVGKRRGTKKKKNKRKQSKQSRKKNRKK
ncbi:MAG: DUF1186 domain-containing protein [Bacteroidota bacterium]